MSGCGYEGFHFGAIYPDGGCHGGHLHDLDGDGYDPDDATHPCPNCNAGEFFERAVENSCDTSDEQARAWAAKLLGACLVYHLMDREAQCAYIRARQAGTAEPLVKFPSQGVDS